jgi:hypothetical protein
MDITDCKLNIILCNTLLGFDIPEISHSIKHCSDIKETAECINTCTRSGYQILVVCQQKDEDQLMNQIPNGRIDTIYVLDDAAISAQNNNRRIAASTGKALKTFFILGAARYIRGRAAAAQNQSHEYDGIANALHHTADRLHELVYDINKQ